MRYKGIKIILLLTTIIVIICMSPLFNVTTIYIKNNNNVKQDEIYTLTELNSYRGNIFLYPIRKYKNQLLSNPYIKDATITKAYPDTIIVTVKERNVIAYVMYAENTYLFINEEGIVLESKQNITKTLPIITGINFDKFSIGEKIQVENTESLRIAEELSTILTRYNSNEREVKIDTRDTNNITLTVENLSVIFGDFNGADEKVRLMLASIDALPDENIKGFLYVNDLTQSPRLKIIT